MSTATKEMKVDAICEGSVIDHIPAGRGLDVMRLLQLPEEQREARTGRPAASPADAPPVRTPAVPAAAPAGQAPGAASPVRSSTTPADPPGAVPAEMPAGRPVLMIGVNLGSGKHGRKDLVKIEGYELSEAEAAVVALIAPEATLSIIQEYRVARKSRLSLPPEIRRYGVCRNPNCITNIEGIETRFTVQQRPDAPPRATAGGLSASPPPPVPVHLHCRYCEKEYRAESIEIRLTR